MSKRGYHTGLKQKVYACLERGPKTARQISEETGIDLRRVSASVSKARISREGIYIFTWVGTSIKAQPVYALGDAKDAPQPAPITAAILSHLQAKGAATNKQVTQALGLKEHTARTMLPLLRDKGLVHVSEWVWVYGRGWTAMWSFGKGKDAPKPLDSMYADRKLKPSEIRERLKSKPITWMSGLLP